MLAAANTYFRFMGWDELKLKSIRLQRRFFRENERELTKAEYQLLMETAKKRGDERLALLMETICATGIRVSEVPYITTCLLYTSFQRLLPLSDDHIQIVCFSVDDQPAVICRLTDDLIRGSFQQLVCIFTIRKFQHDRSKPVSYTHLDVYKRQA